MSNYFVIHRPSNSIINVIASSVEPTSTDKYKFVEASEGRLSQYYARRQYNTPIDLYSIISKPTVPEILPLSSDDMESLNVYVSKYRHRETVERMSYVWRVSERTIRDVLKAL
ncbi:hypothetical protein [Pseudomonas petrae]|uniref:Uncharacterized protein n=1 Tax=Pseudomonas petrae TaxID=2912190 RepID=A0ABS9IF28_9PSED|nr:hypothetical protein [Pseudomonas petrae]MCF7540221.1 hypothetical protein [Pseudomonas petrae]MCF7545691.1 hypothetical protein [Pseudomonas petrae]